MRKIITTISLVILTFSLAMSQSNDSTNIFVNSAEKLLQTDGKLKIGGYGEVHYNQPLDDEIRQNGKLDVHRIVMLFGYQFNDRTQFVTEIEYEHVEEVYIEQAWLQYQLNDYINFRTGLILTPMGLINEYHEPTTFNGVERPWMDKYIVPTTWREIGVGINGNILQASMRYQAYIMNGFNGFDGEGQFGGSSGLRGGRQKAIESYISSPNFTGKVEYYGIRGLNIGLSGYFGRSQSQLYDGIEKDNSDAEAIADSSSVGISMIGLDARYQYHGFEMRGQYYYAAISNTDQYNAFTAAADGTPNDLGSAMSGFYAEAGYNVLRLFSNTNKKLVPFVRYSNYNTHASVEDPIQQNDAYNRSVLTTGLTLQLAKGAVLKTDVQFFNNEAADEPSHVFNAGFGVMF